MARKNKLDLTVGIAVGSSQQIALFVAPLLVLMSYAVAPKPMNLVFGNAGLVIIFLAVLITGMIASDGKSTVSKASNSSASTCSLLSAATFCLTPWRR